MILNRQPYRHKRCCSPFIITFSFPPLDLNYFSFHDCFVTFYYPQRLQFSMSHGQGSWLRAHPLPVMPRHYQHCYSQSHYLFPECWIWCDHLHYLDRWYIYQLIYVHALPSFHFLHLILKIVIIKYFIRTSYQLILSVMCHCKMP